MLGHYFLHHSLTFVGTLCRSYFPAIVYRPSFNKSKSGSGTINAKCEQINFLPIYTKNLLRFIMAAAIFRCRNMRMGPIAAFVLQINLKSTQCIEVNRYWPASTAFMRCVTWRLADVDCLVPNHLLAQQNSQRKHLIGFISISKDSFCCSACCALALSNQLQCDIVVSLSTTQRTLKNHCVS